MTEASNNAGVLELEGDPQTHAPRKGRQLQQQRRSSTDWKQLRETTHPSIPDGDTVTPGTMAANAGQSALAASDSSRWEGGRHAGGF